MAEAAFAIDEGKKVIPVLYRDCKIPLRLRPFQYVDFRGNYDEALQTLLDSMGTERLLEKTASQSPVAVAAEPKPSVAERSTREQQPASTPRSEETEFALRAAAARSLGDYGVEVGSYPQGSFVYTKFSPGFMKIAIVVGILVIAFLIYLAVRHKSQGSQDWKLRSDQQSQAPWAKPSASRPLWNNRTIPSSA
jgi:hypothetical protein